MNNKLYEKNNGEKKIYLVLKPTFQDLESLLRTAKTLISCHGAITHAANSLDIRIIDIIEKDKKLFYQRFTSYMSNYTYIYRENFNSIKRNLFNKLNE